MKSANVRVALELREEAESVLERGETLSAFVEQSLRVQIARRLHQKDFLERGLASSDEARRSGVYYAADDVLKELDKIWVDAKSIRAKE